MSDLKNIQQIVRTLNASIEELKSRNVNQDASIKFLNKQLRGIENEERPIKTTYVIDGVSPGPGHSGNAYVEEDIRAYFDVKTHVTFDCSWSCKVKNYQQKAIGNLYISRDNGSTYDLIGRHEFHVHKHEHHVSFSGKISHYVHSTDLSSPLRIRMTVGDDNKVVTHNDDKFYCTMSHSVAVLD